MFHTHFGKEAQWPPRLSVDRFFLCRFVRSNRVPCQGRENASAAAQLPRSSQPRFQRAVHRAELPIEGGGFPGKEKRSLHRFAQYLGNILCANRAITVRPPRKRILAPMMTLRIEQQLA